jgi:hypothetical protein
VNLDPLKDYEFGWRWLLPIQEGITCQLYGFNVEEELFWHTAPLALSSSPSSARPKVLLVNLHSGYGCTGPTDTEVSSANVVCIVTNRSNARPWRARLVAEFPRLKEYGLLPAANPRVIVPLAAPQQTVAALGLHRPGRWVARLGVGVARVLAGFGNFSLLRSRVLLIATREPEQPAHGSVVAGWPVSGGGADKVEYALYLGTPDDNRKTVVVPLGLTTPVVMLKVAMLDKARDSLRNEAAALVALALSPLAIHIPKLVDVVDSSGILTIYQEYRPRKAIRSRQMHKPVIAFLAGLSRIDRRKERLSVLLDEIFVDACSGLSDKVSIAFRALYARLEALSKAGALLWVHRSHGDFASWNFSWSPQGIFVFDWETSRAQELAFCDSFYYVIAPALLLQRKPHVQETLDAALFLAQQVAESADMAEVDCRIYLALWLMARVAEASLYGDLLKLLERNWL